MKNLATRASLCGIILFFTIFFTVGCDAENLELESTTFESRFSRFRIIDQIRLNGNGCPVGSYDVIASEDGTQISILFSEFTAETEEGRIIDWANCNIALPLTVPQGLSVGLLGVDFRGYAYIPRAGYGKLTTEYFFNGTKVPAKQHMLSGYFDDEFFFEDDLAFIAYSPCGQSSVIARANTTIRVKKKSTNSLEDAYMTVFSEDTTFAIAFNLDWKTCN